MRIETATDNAEARERKFKVGDRVRCIAEEPRGHSGTVRFIDAYAPEYLVEFDDWHNGHDGRTHITKGAPHIPGETGWYLFADHIELIPASDNATASDAPQSPAPFKVGDRVVRSNGKITVLGTILPGGRLDRYNVQWDNGRGDSDTWQAYELRLANPKHRPCIVAKLNSIGQPLPSARPFVHPGRDAATAEAERLAGLNLGERFAVYELVSTSAAARPEVVTEAA